MKIITNPKEMQTIVMSLKSNSTIGLVPTMGALHNGHRSLVWKSKTENDVTVVSLFVNPTQFNDPKDFKNYPNTLEQDQQLLSDEKVDILFQPNFAELYPDHYNYSIHEKDWSSQLCGRSRPGHFTGVLTVVLKLLNITQPTRAYFGEKDFQQLLLIQEMARAFFIPTQIVPCPIVRDEFGLALSSRNIRLSPEGVNKARVFATNLRTSRDPKEFFTTMEDLGIKVDYIEDLNHRRFAAVEIDDVRLIDNVPI